MLATCLPSRRLVRRRLLCQLRIEWLESRRVLTGPINTQDRLAVVDAYLNTFLPTQSVPIGWTGNNASCVAGTISPAAQQATLTAVNYFRNMSGVNDVSFDSALSSSAQQAALIMSAQGALSHFPPPSWKCYTTEGANAAGKSNIALGFAGAKAITAYMDDFGSGNEVVGHRRWIQNPFIQTMGSGSTSNSNALWVLNSSAGNSPTWISWPPAGYVPKDLIYNRWSLSRDGADFSAADVSMTVNGQAINRTIVSSNAVGYALNTIVWESTIPNLKTTTNDISIQVTVSNVRVNGQPQTFQYRVTAIEPQTPALSIAFASPSVAENAGVQNSFITVTRAFSDNSSSLVVNLTSSDITAATVPTSVTIPAGQSSFTVALTPIDDTAIDGTQVTTITASANGLVSANADVSITDNDQPVLSLALNPQAINEKGGSSIATISRTGPATASLVINLTSSDTSEATVPATVTIPAGSANATFTISAVDDALLDGTQTATITASAKGATGTSSIISIIDDEVPTIALSLSSGSMSEKNGSVTATLTRVGSLSNSLVVSLSTNDGSEASVPISVTIPAGSASATFTVTSVDDSVVDGDQTVTITASAIGFSNAKADVVVTDDDTATASLTLTIATPTISENGGTSIGTVSRSGPTTSTLTVNLTSSDTTEATVPASVTIPAGQSSVTFSITAVNDTLLDGLQTATLTASASGFASATATINVADDEQPALALTFSTSTFSEKNGTSTGTVSRTGATSVALIVNLTSNDSSEATVPATVTIPAGASSATFTVTAVDDSILDGTQTVAIGASASGYQSTSANVQVTDDESAALTLSLATNAISEKNGTTTGTIARSGPTTNSLTVSLLSSDTSEATVPATVIIPAGSAIATFTVTAVDDSVLDGTQSVIITASASGFADRTVTLSVTDDEQPSLSVSATASSFSEKNGQSLLTINRSGPTTAAVTVTIASSDSTELSVPSTVTIPAGSASTTVTVNGVDDALTDGTQSVALTFTASGYQSTSIQLAVTDDEMPGLSLTLASNSISEAGGVTQATLARDGSTASALTVNLTSNDPSEATVPATVTIAAGASSVVFQVTGVDDSLADGNLDVLITASAVGMQSATAQVTVTDNEQADLVLTTPLSVNEKAGTINVFLKRNTSATSLTVQLASSDTSAVIVPSSVTFGVGVLQVSVPVTIVDDSVADGDQNATISAVATGLSSAFAALTVTDDEAAALSLQFDTSSISEKGGSAVATVTRNTPLNRAVTVNITNSDSSEASVPTQIVIPAGAPSVTFRVNGVDDVLSDGPVSIVVTVAASGHQNASAGLTVLDDDLQSLVFDVSNVTMSERNGQIIGSVRLPSPTSVAMSVDITSSDRNAALVPTSIVIPANSAVANFFINAVDDSLLDGTQSVDITVTAQGYSPITRSLNVTDYETLAVVVSSQQVVESGGPVTASVIRSNTDRGSDLVVNLSSSDLTAATVPAQVTIPAGSAFVSFDITPVNDPDRDPTQISLITVDAAGYQLLSGRIEVLDDEPGPVWQNSNEALDVNNDNFITAFDALVLINQLNSLGARPLDIPSAPIDEYVDVNGDDNLSAIDALMVINYLNTNALSLEGEMAGTQGPANDVALLDLMSGYSAEEDQDSLNRKWRATMRTR